MTAPYQLVFMPYLAMGGTDRIQIGEVELWNFDSGKESIADPALRQRVDELLAMYRQNGHDARSSVRLRNMGIVSVGAPNFQPLNDHEFGQVQEARQLLFLCCLAQNCLQHGPNAGHLLFTSENFDLIRQNFALDTEHVAETTGVIVQMWIGGYSISQTRFTKPSYVNLPIRFNTDEVLLRAVLELKDAEPAFFRRVVRAAALMLESYYNSHSVDIGARVLLQAAAFEVLLDLPEKAQRKALKERLERLANAAGEKTYEYRYEMPGGPQIERRSIKGMWADRFYTLRNHIIHGEEVSHRDFRFLRAQHHLQIAPLMFVHALKKMLDERRNAGGGRRLFFERIDWGVINEGDEFESRSIGFQVTTDFAARIEQWIKSQGPDVT